MILKSLVVMPDLPFIEDTSSTSPKDEKETPKWYSVIYMHTSCKVMSVFRLPMYSVWSISVSVVSVLLPPLSLAE